MTASEPTPPIASPSPAAPLASQLAANPCSHPSFDQFVATIAALRLVGILFAEWNALGQARRARGLGAGQSLAGRAQTFGGQSFALLVQAIRRGSRLAVTMEARGFGAGERTWARVPSYSRRDVHVSIAAAVIIAVAYGASIAAGTIQFLWG